MAKRNPRLRFTAFPLECFDNFRISLLPVDDVVLPGLFELVLIRPDEDAVLQVRHTEDDLHLPLDGPFGGACI